MPYANVEDRRAYANKHYQENKQSYNPLRTNRRRSNIGNPVCDRGTWGYRVVVEFIKAESNKRFIHPKEIAHIVTRFYDGLPEVSRLKAHENVVREMNIDCAKLSWADAYDPWLVSRVAKNPSIEEVGLLNGEIVFFRSEKFYRSFLRQIPKNPQKEGSNKVELLILNLTVKELKNAR